MASFGHAVRCSSAAAAAIVAPQLLLLPATPPRSCDDRVKHRHGRGSAVACAAPPHAGGHAGGGLGASPKITCFGEAMIRYVPDPETPAAGAAQQDWPQRFVSRWLRGAGGAELNVAVALARLGWGSRSRWVSVAPTGVLGDDFLALLGQAFPDGEGRENLSLVRREPGDVGIYHVWPAKHQIWYQRTRSVFGLLDPAWFGEQFWLEVLAAPTVAQGEPAPHVLHLTGITPQISASAYKAWWWALKVASTLKESGHHLVVSLDLNHRPALGTWEDLWILVEPHLGCVDFLVLSIGDLVHLGKLLNIPDVAGLEHIPEAVPANAAAMDAQLQRGLAAARRRLGEGRRRVPALALTCKCREKRPPGELGGGVPEQLRWSMVCTEGNEVVTTLPSAVRQQPLEEIGGGDSWVSGVIDGLVGSAGHAAAAPHWPAEMWRRALERGDVLAALKQQVLGDFSHVERSELDQALQRHLAACLQPA